MSASTSSNGADWHLGVLRLPMTSSLTSPDVEDWYFSGVYIESGTITTSPCGPGCGSYGSGGSSGGGSGSGSTTAKATTTLVTSTKPATTVPATTTTAAASGGSLAKYSQCGGTGWTGSGTCVAGTTCTVLNAYYSQCL